MDNTPDNGESLPMRRNIVVRRNDSGLYLDENGKRPEPSFNYGAGSLSFRMHATEFHKSTVITGVQIAMSEGDKKAKNFAWTWDHNNPTEIPDQSKIPLRITRGNPPSGVEFENTNLCGGGAICVWYGLIIDENGAELCLDPELQIRKKGDPIIPPDCQDD